MDDLPAPSDSSQVEARKGHELRTFLPSEQKKTEERRKMTTFGVEISERNHDVSVSASHGSILLAPVARCDVLHSESSSISSWSKLPSCLSQSPISIHENSCSNRLHVTGNARLNRGFRAGVSDQNGVCLSSQLRGQGVTDLQMKGSLHWLADVMSLCKGDPEKEVGAVSRGREDEEFDRNRGRGVPFRFTASGFGGRAAKR